MAQAQRTVFVGRIDQSATREDLQAAFQRIGEVEKVEIRSGPSSTYAFVRFLDARDARDAVQEMNGVEIPRVGRIVTELAKSDNETGGTRRSMVCFRCGGEGHRASECRFPPQNDRGPRYDDRGYDRPPPPRLDNGYDRPPPRLDAYPPGPPPRMRSRSPPAPHPYALDPRRDPYARPDRYDPYAAPARDPRDERDARRYADEPPFDAYARAPPRDREAPPPPPPPPIRGYEDAPPPRGRERGWGGPREDGYGKAPPPPPGMYDDRRAAPMADPRDYRRPVEDDRRAPYDERKPAYDERRPPVDDRRPPPPPPGRGFEDERYAVDARRR